MRSSCNFAIFVSTIHCMQLGYYLGTYAVLKWYAWKFFEKYCDVEWLKAEFCEEVKERLGDVMGGKVLEPESERLLRIGREAGAQETVIAMYRAGVITLEYACGYLGISEEGFIEKEKAAQ